MGWRLYNYIFIKCPSYENDSDTKSGKDKQQAEVDNLSDIARIIGLKKCKKARDLKTLIKNQFVMR